MLPQAGGRPELNLSRDSEQRETDEFEEEERRLLAEDAKVGGVERGSSLASSARRDQHECPPCVLQTSSSLAFALPGRWTGGRREVCHHPTLATPPTLNSSLLPACPPSHINVLPSPKLAPPPT